VEFLDRLLAGLLGHQLLEADEVILALVGRIQLMRVRLGQILPSGVVGEVVVLVGPDERDQVGDGLERVQILVLAEERLPFVALIAPAWSPQRVQIALGQREPDRHDVSSHGAQPNDGAWWRSTHADVAVCHGAATRSRCRCP
jgi:hypothetical protein